jgi:hypothetical protein
MTREPKRDRPKGPRLKLVCFCPPAFASKVANRRLPQSLTRQHFTPVDRPGFLSFVLLSPSESHAGPPPVLIDELEASFFESPPDREIVCHGQCCFDLLQLSAANGGDA